MKTNNNISVLIPDGESHLLIYVVNCLAQIKGLKIFVMSNKNSNPMRLSRYIYNFSFFEKTNEIDWIYNINKELIRYDIDVVMPIFEDGIRTIIKHENLVNNKSKLGLLPSFSVFNIAINKGCLAEHLKTNNLPHPKGVVILPGATTSEKEIKLPALIKPMEGFGGGMGIKVFNSKKQIDHFFDENKFNYPYLVQDYIEGYDIDCSVLCKNGEVLAYTIQKGNLLGKNEFSPQVGLEFLHNEELYKVVEKLMKSLNWSGIAHIDMRYDKHDEKFKVIEINTRYWVSLDASLISGVNFPHLYCLASLNQNFIKPDYKNIEYLNLKGLIKKIKIKKTTLFNFKFIIANTPLKFAIKDPLPMIYKFIWRTKNVILAKFS
ncbi:ATP-grasp domain-containing protein [Flaviramulus sp. BrNp1-15]|uniref:ATP-grasp domain-containing protein n=1 Tax=Flaviramulus sp. BrNp1-15 TaxID=2916754 RepID=UPI001EE9386E|nr:ATP-grasp domain-containing protein [Flaviramulus sp. BrNp1-15]ULC58323.1 ATP-grasp domain-containing protein [Flaviramulus sp. BrNp1-15]